MQSFKIIKRIRKESPDPVKYLRLNRAEFASTFKLKKYDYDNYYPDITPLIQAASKFYKVKEHLVYVGLGAESIIRDIFLLFYLKRKKNYIGLNSPNFFRYKYYSELFSYNQKEYIIKPDKIQNLSTKFIKKFISKNKLNFFVLVNPSHPFEKFWNIKEIEEIIIYCNKKNVTVLVDEVYQGIESKSALRLLKKYNKLIILKNNKKTSGLPGLRVGFAMSCEKIIDELNTIRLAIELPESSIRKAVSYLTNPQKKIFSKIKSIEIARNFAHKELKKRKIKSYNFYGNSVTFQIENSEKVKKIGEFLKKNKILINYLYPKPLDIYMNITTTNIKNLKHFFYILDKALKIYLIN